MKNTDNEIFNSLRKLFKENKGNIVVITHENPDGDAIGSSVGIAEVLRNYGHTVNIIVPNDYPAFLKWFSSDINIIIYDKAKRKAQRLIKSADLIICLDFNNPDRTAKMSRYILQSDQPKVMVDHHPNPEKFCNYMISETEYSSTAELVFRLLERIKLTKYMNCASAEALYAGVMTDTGSFSHNIARQGPFLVAAELMKWDIDTEKIHAAVYHNYTFNRMKLLGYCLNKKMEVYPELRSAVIYISREELHEYNFQPGDTEGFVNYPLSINNIIFSALFIEKRDVVKASFRSKGSFPVNLFSQRYYNGGGHLNAAGGESKLSLSETIERFKQQLDEYKEQLLEIKV